MLLIVLASMSAALVAALVAVPEHAEAAPSCKKIDSLRVPGAERQDKYCLADLTTEGLQLAGRTDRTDWQGLNAAGSANPPEPVPGIQVDGYFPTTRPRTTTTATGTTLSS